MENTTTDEKEIETIKSLYRDMLETARLNNPHIYLMPVSYYNQIVKKISYLERALKNAKNSRDVSKEKLKHFMVEDDVILNYKEESANGKNN